MPEKDLSFKSLSGKPNENKSQSYELKPPCLQRALNPEPGCRYPKIGFSIHNILPKFCQLSGIVFVLTVSCLEIFVFLYLTFSQIVNSVRLVRVP